MPLPRMIIVVDGLGPPPAAPLNTALPEITGTPEQGETLSCSTGTWSNDPTSYLYQWERDGVAVVGATGSTYLLTINDADADMTCVVTANNSGGSRSAESEPVGPVVPLIPVNLSLPAITGTTTQGETLSCSTGTWSNAPTGFAYAWARDGEPIEGAEESTYLLVEDDVGSYISCAVTASNSGGDSAPAESASVGPVNAAAPVNTSPPVISGVRAVGKTLMVSPGVWTNQPSSFSYQWRRNASPIFEAITNAYTLIEDDINKVIDALVTAHNAGGSAQQDSNAAGDVLPLAPVYWFMADRDTYADADAEVPCLNDDGVYNWLNQGTAGDHGVQATSARRPTFKTGGLNSKPFLHCAAATEQWFNDLLQGDQPGGFTTFNPFTIFVVVDNLDLAAQRAVFGSPDVSSVSSAKCLSNFSSAKGGIFQSFKNDVDVALPDPDGPNVVCIGKRASVAANFLRGSNDAAAAHFTVVSNAPTTANTTMRFLRHGSTPGAFFDGDLYEIIYFNQELTLAQCNEIIAMLVEKYDLA